MQTINLLINNYLIIAFIDGKLSANEISQIQNNFTQEYWFYRDIFKDGELKKFIIKNILSLKGFSKDKLQKQFLANTKSLKNNIPINQKLLHIKALQRVANIKGMSAGEEKLVKQFSDVFSNSVAKEYPMLSLSFENFKKYIVTLIKYCQIDKIDEYERLFLIQEIEMYLKSHARQEEDEEELYRELIDIARSKKNAKVGAIFTKEARELFVLFNPTQDAYFKKVVVALRDVDTKISTQEKSFDNLFVIAHNSAQRKENKIEVILNEIADSIASFKITAQKRQLFTEKLNQASPSDDKLKKLHKAFVNMENILCLRFTLEKLGEDELLNLFKENKLDFQRQLFINKLLYIKNIENKHIIDDELYEKFIEHIASVSFNYYYDIALKTIEDEKKLFPLFDFRSV